MDRFDTEITPLRADTSELAQLTGRFPIDPVLLAVTRGDRDETSTFAFDPIDVAAAFAERTEEVPMLHSVAPDSGARASGTHESGAQDGFEPTLEQTLFDEPLPLPPRMHGDPAYFIEVRPARSAPSLLAVRATLDDALHVARTVHPGAADVTIRELALPCDADALARAAGCRTWTRRPDGSWSMG